MTPVYQSNPEFAESLEIAKQLLNSVRDKLEAVKADPTHPMFKAETGQELVFCGAATLAFEVYCEMYPAPEEVVDISALMAFCEFMGTWAAQLGDGTGQIAVQMLCQEIFAAWSSASVIHQPIGSC